MHECSEMMNRNLFYLFHTYINTPVKFVLRLKNYAT